MIFMHQAQWTPFPYTFQEAFSGLCNLPVSYRELQELFPLGIGMHHAGMLRSDRSLMERLFAQGLLKVRYYIPLSTS